MLDVRGLSCPEPVLLVKKALLAKPEKYEVLADSHVSVENIRKMAQFMHYRVCVDTSGAANGAANSEYKLVLERQDAD